jgi:glycerol-3-phosphate acyltransferase PlsX
MIKMIRIAVDAMGGDHAPKEIVGGAIEAARKSDGRYEIVLVGDKIRIEEEMDHHHFIKDLPISVEHASQKVEMHESPATSLRKKPDSSIAVAVRLHKEGKVDAVVSAGNTGAVMASALFLLRTIEGVQRPAIGSFMPHEDGVCLLIDAGSNVDCKPEHYLQFGIMGSIFMNHIIGIHSPRIGLLNIGEESSKGNEVVQQAYGLLEKSSLNFKGNLEGRDILRGVVDVVVCDGFVGNILLKFAESLARMISKTMKRTIRGNLPGAVGLYLIRPSLRKLYRLFDYQEYGGAPLLGVKGNCIISHGSSTSRAIKNAVEEAWKMIKSQVTQHIESQIHRMKGEIREG